MQRQQLLPHQRRGGLITLYVDVTAVNTHPAGQQTSRGPGSPEATTSDRFVPKGSVIPKVFFFTGHVEQDHPIERPFGSLGCWPHERHHLAAAGSFSRKQQLFDFSGKFRDCERLFQDALFGSIQFHRADVARHV